MKSGSGLSEHGPGFHPGHEVFSARGLPCCCCVIAEGSMRIESRTASVWTQLTPLSPPDVVVAQDTTALPRAVFIDLDGGLVEHEPYNVDPALLDFRPRALDGLRLLADAGYRLIVVTLQPGLAYGLFNRAALSRLHAALSRMARDEGIRIADFLTCPHAPSSSPRMSACLCRVPSPGLMRQAARSHGLDLAGSWVAGSTLDHVEAGHRAGGRSVLLDAGRETEWRLSPLRKPDLRAGDLLLAAEAMLECDLRRDGDAAVLSHAG